MIRPTHAQRTLAYVANGDWPPFGVAQLLPFAISTAASLALGVLLGSAIV